MKNHAAILKIMVRVN